MMKNRKVIFLTILSILVLVAFFILTSIVSRLTSDGLSGNLDNEQINKNIGQPAGQDPLVTPGDRFLLRESDPIFGETKAKVRIVEFGDFQCPYCADMRQTLATVLPEFKNRVSLIWKDFVNPSHPEAKNAAIAARCAQEQNKFWEYHDYLFMNQDELSREIYNKIALELGLNLSEFNKCVDGRKTVELVGQGMEDGQIFGVDATPYLIIGNKVYNYALTPDELRQILDNLL
jgi:protein-disulfide isomerase